MGEQKDYRVAIPEEILAKAIGQQVLDFVKTQDSKTLVKLINKEAFMLLEKIKAILDDDTLNDPECFYRIDAMVDAFYEAGSFVKRHD